MARRHPNRQVFVSEPELFTFLSIQTILRFYMLRLNHKIEFRYNLLQCVS